TNEQFFVLEDPNNPGFYLRDANGDTTFANSANPFDPTVAGSLPLYEDVRMSSYRLVGMTAKALALRIPGIEGPDAINNHGSNNSAAQFEGYNYRYGGKLDIEIPDTTWHASLSYVWHEARAFQDFKNESLSATITGVNGELPITDDLGVVSPEWFNPFSTQVFTCPSWTVNASGELVCAEGLVQTDPDQLNSATVWDRISFRQQAKNIWRNNLVDVVFSGDLYDLPFSWNDGTVGLAIGGQYNKVKREFNGGPLMNSDDLWIGIKADDWNKNRDERAIFGEIIVPLWNTEMLGVAEIQAAGRYTDVEDIETSWDPKVAGRWEPRPWLAIRGSWGTSFIAPSMDDLFEPQVLGLSQYADPIRGDGEAFRPREIGGTPGLQPEESKNFNVGATFLLLDDALSVSVDYSEFHFDNRIVRPLPDDIFDLEQIRYGQFAAANGITLEVDGSGLPIPTDPVNAGDIPANNTLLFQWVTNLKDAGTGEDPRIVRSTPTPLEIANELVPQLRFVDAALVNAQTQDVKVYDFNVKYRFDSQQIPWFDADFGSFELGLSGTYMKEYSWVQGGVDQRSQSGEGKQNNSTSFAPPTPEWRLRQKTSWLYGRHSVSMITQFISEVEQDDGICAAFTPFFPTFCEDEFERWFEVDLQYNLTWGVNST
ncbi:MAG: TonB-dependent receptor, partial [Gammaproteobacteria bacterium]